MPEQKRTTEACYLSCQGERKPDNERLKINFAGEKANWPERMQSVEVLGENPVTFMKEEKERS
jgi:hypothetical protein